MEEYLKVLLEQVRCKKAHPFIEEEIRGHMEEQIADNIAFGMTEEEAEKAAIADMGSPVEAGISLDRIHKPRMAWGMIGFMAVISIIGIVIHRLIVYKMLISSQFIGNVTAGSSSFVLYTAIGFIVMLVICHIDYSTIAKYAKVIAFVFLVAVFLYSPMMFGELINGRVFWIAGFGSVRVSLSSFLMLYVPLYGAVIYKYYGTGYRGLFKSILWMIAPIFIAISIVHVVLAAILLVSLGVVLSLAIWNNWFDSAENDCTKRSALKKRLSKKTILAGLWGGIVGLPSLGLGIAYAFGGLADYQVDRIRAFITNSGEANYLTNMFRTYLDNCQLFGNSGMEVVGYIPEFNSQWILVYLSSTYGVIAGALICCILAVLVVKIFSISLKQKNQLGMVMGCGCGMVFLINFVLNILENIGWLPLSQTFLPFISAGGSDIVVCYALMGIVLSIYRHKSIYPKHINTKIKDLKIEISL